MLMFHATYFTWLDMYAGYSRKSIAICNHKDQDQDYTEQDTECGLVATIYNGIMACAFTIQNR